MEGRGTRKGGARGGARELSGDLHITVLSGELHTCVLKDYMNQC